jgi:hypothetical protein
MAKKRLKKISESEKSSKILFSLRCRNRRYNIRHPKLKAFKMASNNYQFPPLDDKIDFIIYKRISEVRPDIHLFCLQANYIKSSISRYKRYKRYYADKFSNMAYCREDI